MLNVIVKETIWETTINMVRAATKSWHGRAGNVACSPRGPHDCYLVVIYRLAKSTLVLIPLLGVHEILFSFITDDQVEGFAKLIRLFIQLTLSSFHVSRNLNQDALTLEKTKCMWLKQAQN